jgi:hypothetical protein
MTFILYILTIVAASGSNHGHRDYKDWRYMGEYKSYGACVEASTRLQRKPHEFLCQPTDTPKHAATKATKP